MLSELQQYLRTAASARRETAQVGPFWATSTPSNPFPFISYAIPDDGAEPTQDDVAALAAWFEARERVPRLEYLDKLSPAVEAALLAGGFTVENRLAAMTCTRAAEIAVPAGIAIEPVGDADLRAVLAVQDAAFGGSGEVAEEAVERARARAGGGALALLARDLEDGSVVGAANATAPARFTEIAGVAVASSHRRRGIATALTADLTRQALAAGVETAFLTPADDGAAQAYLRAGYAEMGSMLHISRE